VKAIPFLFLVNKEGHKTIVLAPLKLEFRESWHISREADILERER